MNLEAASVGDGQSTSMTLDISGRVTNSGWRAVGTFTTQLRAWKAVYDATGGCLSDVNAPGLEPGGYVHLDSGERRRISDLPRRADGSIDVGTLALVATSMPNAQSWVATATASIPVGQSQNVVRLQVAVPPGGIPAAYVTQLTADSMSVIDEFDEHDNGRGTCHVLRNPAP